MTVKVIDASAFACILFNEDGADAVTRRLDGCQLVAPNLLHYELANVTWKKARRAGAAPDELQEAFARRGKLGVQMMQVDHDEALRIAVATGLSAYDASYLWLARHLDAELVTLDAQLARAALAKAR